MKKIIMFVMVLAISAPALADDLNPPDWALGPGTIYGIWGFPSSGSGQIGDYPEEGEMVPHATHPDPEDESEPDDTDEIAHHHQVVNWAEDVSWLASHEGREGVIEVGGLNFGMFNFPGDGSKMIRLQVTWMGSEIEIFYFDAPPRAEWNGPADDFLIETVDLGDGWFHSTYDFPIGANPDWEQFWVGPPSTTYYDQIVIDTICYPGAEPPDGPGRGGPPPPTVTDPNVMTVYETDETEGDFGISLLNEPPVGATITVTVDPNGDGDMPNEDITLLNGTGPGNTVTFTFDLNNWDVPQIVTFKAIDDDIAEPPALLESQSILVSSSWPGHESDANFVGESFTTVKVMDNDQANILFSKSAINLREEPIGIDWFENPIIKEVTVGVTLQVAPSGGPVKLQAGVTGDIIGDNLPLTEVQLNPDKPDLPFEEADDPNGLIFTFDNYDVPQNIKFWAYDDDVLQVEGASSEGDQDYQATLSVWVVDDGGDERFAPFTEESPKTVDIDIQDNECGAFGIMAMDISSSDPCAVGEPDCYVDIYDAIEFATQWLDCSNIQDPSCESYL